MFFIFLSYLWIFTDYPLVHGGRHNIDRTIYLYDFLHPPRDDNGCSWYWTNEAAPEEKATTTTYSVSAHGVLGSDHMLPRGGPTQEKPVPQTNKKELLSSTVYGFSSKSTSNCRWIYWWCVISPVHELLVMDMDGVVLVSMWCCKPLF